MPEQSLVSNATIDEFPSTVEESQVPSAKTTAEELCQIFGDTRKFITDKFEVLEAKHKIR